MAARRQYATAGAFRTALEARLNERARRDGVDLRVFPVFRWRQAALPALASPEPRRQELELLRLRIGERLEDGGVQDREDGRVRADAEAEREHDNAGESGSLADCAERVANVLDDLVEPTPRPDGSRILLCARHVSIVSTLLHASLNPS
jgi:hypothetical protein